MMITNWDQINHEITHLSLPVGVVMVIYFVNISFIMSLFHLLCHHVIYSFIMTFTFSCVIYFDLMSCTFSSMLSCSLSLMVMSFKRLSISYLWLSLLWLFLLSLLISLSNLISKFS